MYEYYNPNPCNKRVGDCTVRAICKILNKEWQDVYIDLCLLGLKMCDMPSSNNVWGEYLNKQGYERHIIPESETVESFCEGHPNGKYLLALQSHVVTIENGNYYDMWDSGNEVPLYYWKRKEN